MREAVIVSTARTPMTTAHRGEFNTTAGPTLVSFAVRAARGLAVVGCIPSERLNVNGGPISIGHPFGMTGSRLAGHVLIEGRRRGVQ